MLRSMLYRCYADGYNVDVIALKNSKVKPGESTAVYLTIDELKKLEQIELIGTLAHIRDHFLISCYTGLRFQDLTEVRKENISHNIIVVATQKTVEKVMIPLHPVVSKILKSHDDGVPLNFSNSYFNSKIKLIAEQAGVVESVIVSDIRQQGKKFVKTVPKYKLIASRTGRRTFATNMYILNPHASVYPIMLLTGHKTEESFFRYIRLTKQENAEQLFLNHPFYRHEASTVTEEINVKI